MVNAVVPGTASTGYFVSAASTQKLDGTGQLMLAFTVGFLACYILVFVIKMMIANADDNCKEDTADPHPVQVKAVLNFSVNGMSCEDWAITSPTAEVNLVLHRRPSGTGH